MFETKPRRIASSAISRWLQWLIGRSLSDGFSQVIAITAQICSGVYVAGAPERGASASRSGTDWAGGACRHRPRQYRTVFGHTSSSRALSRTPTSSAACNIMRIRNANCCDVEWARSSASSASRCAGSTITGSAANRGIATSCLSFRLVMPHRRRFDSALCRKAASFRLPPYLHASRSRDFRSAVLAGRRYIVCRNRQEAEKDAADRASIVAALERQLTKGDKALVGNTGYRRFLNTISDDHFAIDPDKIAEDSKFDGIFVLRTNTDLDPLAAMLCYKQLWTVEQTFRTAKHLLSTRPIFHKLDETIRGHVFCSFLALVLKKALEDRIAALGRSGSWPEIIADLDSLTETEIAYDGKRFIVRSAPRPGASLALRAAGVALPPTVRDAAAS